MSEKEIQKVAKTSADITNDNLQKLRSIFPQFVKDGEIDFDSLEEFFARKGFLAGDEKYGLSWAGKSKAFDDLRRPAFGTLVPQKELSKDWDTTENIFIEGENLEVLKLLQKHYANPGKIKMIYIDPPYNTGKDFIYKDNFTQDISDYYEATGQTKGGIKMTANTEKNGRYHSDWLTMMYPRLFLARNLLQDDGVIFVSIDDNEVANLRLIMDEIFGEENFVANFIWHSSTGGGIRSRFANQSHQYILCYAKNVIKTETFYAPLSDEAKKQYKKEDINGLYREKDFAWKNSSWGTNQKYFIECPDGEKVRPKDGYLYRFIESTFQESLKKGVVVFKKGRNSPLVNESGAQSSWNIYIKKYLGDGTGAPSSVIPREMVGINNEGTTEVNELFGKNIFESPKNVRLIRYLLSLMDGDDAYVLDIFSGSGTTAHSVMALNAEDGGNRKYISVQIPEETEKESEARKAGYKTIADIARERIRRAGEKIDKGDIGFKSFSLFSSNYRYWKPITKESDPKAFLVQEKLFIEHPLVENFSEDSLLREIALKEGFDLNVKIESKKSGKLSYFQISDPDRIMFVCLALKLSEEDVESIKLPKDSIFVCFDNALNDSLKVDLLRDFLVKTI
jgi:adenine-specific DNA-methyltransferase